MPNILLIDTNTTPFNEAYPVYPIGLDYLQGALKQAGFSNTHILDLRQEGGDLTTFNQRERRSLDIIAERVKQTRWDIIGISIRNIDSTYPPDLSQLNLHYYLPQIKAYIDCVQTTSSNKAHIILGGSGFSMMPDEILGYVGGNYYGVVGPAEAVLPQIIADLLDNKPRQRLYRGEAGTKIGKLQNLGLLEKYKYLPQSLSTVGIRTKNGCGQHCGYCPYPGISGSDIITKDISDVLDEVHILTEAGFSSFMFADDVFNASVDHAKQVLKAMLDAGEIPQSWHAYLNPKDIDQELLELIVATNGWSYYANTHPPEERTIVFPFDIDSGCDRILTNIGKNFTTDDMRKSLAALDKVKKAEVSAFSTVFHLLLGYLGEDEESIKQSCEFINETLPDRLSLQLGVRVYPHTPLAQETRGILWHEPADLLEPTFVPFNKAEIKTWLLKYLSPQYGIISEAGNMIQLVKQGNN